MNFLEELESSLKELDTEIKITAFDTGKYIKANKRSIETGLLQISFPEKYYLNFVYIRDLLKNIYLQHRVVLTKNTLVFSYRQRLPKINTFVSWKDNEIFLNFQDTLYSVFIKHKYFLITKPYAYLESDEIRIIMKASKECNLDCVYCYDKFTRNELGRSQPLKLEYVKKLLDILTVSRRKATIQFHGGEPLLAGYEWYKAVLEDIAPQYPWLDINWVIQTNLLEATDELIELFMKNEVGIGSSWNIMNPGLRRRLSDNPNPAKYPNSFKRLQEINEKYGAAMGNIGVIDVVSNKQIGSLVEAYEKYKQEGVVAAFNLIYEVSTMDDNTKKLVFDPSDREKTKQAFKKYYEYLLHDDNNPYAERFAGEIFSMVTGLGSSICSNTYMAENNYLGIQADGSLLPCDTPPFDDRYYIGHITDFNTIEEIRQTDGLKLLSEELRYQENVFCANCNYWRYCFGGCPMQNISKAGSAKFSSPTDCMLFQDRFDTMYNIIREYELSDIKNEVFQNIILKRDIILPKEIQELYFSHTGKYLAHNPNDIFNSEEFQLFRFFNPIMINGPQTDFQRGTINLYRVSDKQERLNLINKYLKECYEELPLKKEGETNGGISSKGC